MDDPGRARARPPLSCEQAGSRVQLARETTYIYEQERRSVYIKYLEPRRGKFSRDDAVIGRGETWIGAFGGGEDRATCGLLGERLARRGSAECTAAVGVLQRDRGHGT